MRFLFVNIDAAPYITAAFVDVTPPQTDNLTGSQASDDLKPIGIDIFIRYRAAAQQSGIDVEQFELLQRLDDLAHGQPLRLTLTVEPERKGRSTQQNRLMWSLLTIMADHYNAGRTGGVTPEECYLDMLQKYGAKVDYLEVPAGALDILRGCYRLVHVVEILDGNRCTVKCTQGSSTFTTGEMKNLIDGIFDRLAEMGVNDPMVTAYWQEWKEP